MRGGYKLKGGERLPMPVANVFRDRTMPFLESGMHLPLDHLMQEAYYQGIKDAVAVMRHPPLTPSTNSPDVMEIDRG